MAWWSTAGLTTAMLTRGALVVCAAIVFMGPAFAGAYLNAQFSNPLGFSQGNGKAQCTGTAMPYVQCIEVTNVTGFAGTFTVKRPNIEVLLVLKCNTNVVWAGERFIGTSDISVSGLPPITGQCWFSWQEGNNNSTADSDFEYQVAFH